MEAPDEEQDGSLHIKQEAKTAGNALSKLQKREGHGGWVAGGCVRPPTNVVPDGVQGPRLANVSWEPRGYEGLEKRRCWVLSLGQRHSYRLELTTFYKGVDVRGRGNGGTCDDCEVGNWVRISRAM